MEIKNQDQLQESHRIREVKKESESIAPGMTTLDLKQVDAEEGEASETIFNRLMTMLKMVILLKSLI